MLPRFLSSVFIVFIFTSFLFAQTDSIQYFNHYWKETTHNSAAYYRLAESNGRLYNVRDYYISGKLQMEGTYTSLMPEIQDGYFTWHFENGQKYAEGNYEHGEREGIWTFWFPDGLKKQEVKFFPGRESEFDIKWESKRLKSSRQLIEKAVDEGKREKTLSLLNSALRMNPYSAEAYYERGLIECEIGEKEVGCSDLLKAREYWFQDMMELNKEIEANCSDRHSEGMK